MTLVVDASVVVAALVDGGSDGTWAEDILANGPLAAPHLVLVETANILRRLELAGSVPAPAARLAHDDLLALRVALYPYEALAARAWALRAKLTIYDASYVALAEALSVPLATLDRKLSRATGPRCRFLTP